MTHILVVQEVCAGVFHDDAAVFDDIAAVGNAERHFCILLDEKHGRTGRANVDQRVKNALDEQWCKTGRRLVEHNHIGLCHQRARHRQHLQLAAGERFAELLLKEEQTAAYSAEIWKRFRKWGGVPEAELFTSEQADAAKLALFDAIAFGCPAMGAEELEETEFAPMFDAVKGSLSGKDAALFGSYGWGDGEWMRTWEDDCRANGMKLVCDSVICCEAPDDEAVENCRKLGAELAK